MIKNTDRALNLVLSTPNPAIISRFEESEQVVSGRKLSNDLEISTPSELVVCSYNVCPTQQPYGLSKDDLNVLRMNIAALSSSIVRFTEDRIEIAVGKDDWADIDSDRSVSKIGSLAQEWSKSGMIGSFVYHSTGPVHEPCWKASCRVDDVIVKASASNKKKATALLNRQILISRFMKPIVGLRDRASWDLQDVRYNINKHVSVIKKDIVKNNDYVVYLDFEFILFKEFVYPLEIGFTVVDMRNKVIYNDSMILKAVMPYKIYKLWSQNCSELSKTFDTQVVGSNVVMNSLAPASIPDSWKALFSNPKSLLVFKAATVDKRILTTLDIKSAVYDLGIDILPVSTGRLARMLDLQMDIHSPRDETYLWMKLTLIDTEIIDNEVYNLTKRPMPISMPSNGHCGASLVHQIFCSRPISCPYFASIRSGDATIYDKMKLLSCCVLPDDLRGHVMHASANKYDMAVISQFVNVQDPEFRMTSRFDAGSYVIYDRETQHLSISYRDIQESNHPLRVPGKKVEGLAGAGLPVLTRRIYDLWFSLRLALVLALLMVVYIQIAEDDIILKQYYNPLRQRGPYHELLGVSVLATQAEVRFSFKQKSLHNHPDKGGSEQVMCQLGDAYAVLRNIPTRFWYEFLGHYVYVGIGEAVISQLTPLVDLSEWERYGQFFFYSLTFSVFTFLWMLGLFIWYNFSLLVVDITELFYDIYTWIHVKCMKFWFWLLRIWLFIIYWLHLRVIVVTFGLVLGRVALVYLLGPSVLLYGSKDSKSDVYVKKKNKAVENIESADYKIEYDHKYTIAQSVCREKIDGGTIDYNIYWMPTDGYCPITAAMFYISLLSQQQSLALNMDMTAIHTLMRTREAKFYSIIDIDRPQDKLYEASLDYAMDDKEAQVSLEAIVQQFCRDNNITCRKQYTLDEVLELFDATGVKFARSGDTGVVLSKEVNGVRHFGVKTLWKTQDFAMPVLWCSLDVLEHYPSITKACYASCFPGTTDVSFRSFIRKLRYLTGETDTMVLISELDLYLNTLRVPYAIRIKDTVMSEPVMFRHLTNKPEVLVLLVKSKQHFEVDEPYDFSCYAKEDTVVDTRPSAGVRAVISSMTATPEVPKDLVSVIDDMKKLYRIIDERVMGGANPFITIHWKSNKRVHCEVDKQHYYTTLQYIACRATGHKYPRCLTEADDDLYILNEAYRVVQYVDIGLIRICVRVHIIKEQYHVDKGMWRFTMKKRYTSNEEHEKRLQEWFDLTGKPDLVRKDIKAAVSAVCLYLSTATKVRPNRDWIASHLVMMLDEHDKIEQNYQCVASGDIRGQVFNNLHKQTLQQLRDYVYVRILPALYTKVDWTRIIKHLLLSWNLCGVIYWVLHCVMQITYVHWIWFLCLFGFPLGSTSMMICFKTLYAVFHYEYDIQVGYAGIVRRLALSQKIELLSRPSWLSSIMNKTTFYVQGKVSTLANFVNHHWDERPKTPEPFISRLIPRELYRKLYPVAPSGIMGATYALLTRQGQPKSIMAPRRKRILRNFKPITDLAHQILHVIYRDGIKSFWEYVATVLPSKRGRYIAGFHAFFLRPVINPFMTYMAKWNEKQDKATPRPRALANPCDPSKAVGGWFNSIVLDATKKTPLMGFNICLGLKPSVLEDRLTHAYNSLNDPVIVTMDGAQWDSHQSRFFMADVDNKILSIIFYPIAALMGLTLHMATVLYNSLTSLYNRLKIKLNDKRMPRMSKDQEAADFVTTGGVMSGKNINTSWGNTIRVLLYMMWMITFMPLVMLWNVNCFFFAAGDDVIAIMEREHIQQFFDKMDYMALTANSYGLTFQDMTLSKTWGQFLSMNCQYAGGRFWNYRQCKKVVQTAAYSLNAEDQKMMDEIDLATTKQLQAMGRNVIGYDSFCKWRVENANAKKISAKTKRFLDNNPTWSMFDEENDLGFREQFASMEDGAKILDSTGGDPYTLIACC